MTCRIFLPQPLTSLLGPAKHSRGSLPPTTNRPNQSSRRLTLPPPASTGRTVPLPRPRRQLNHTYTTQVKPDSIQTVLFHLAADHLAPADISADAVSLFVWVDEFTFTIDVDTYLRSVRDRSCCRCRDGAGGGRRLSSRNFGFRTGFVAPFGSSNCSAAIGGILSKRSWSIAFRTARGGGLSGSFRRRRFGGC